MKGDFSRSSFNRAKHFASVRQQQGRVQIDADGNEAQDIIGHRIDVTARDVIGAAGAPIDTAGFGLTIDATKKILSLSPGCFYVDGILVENETSAILPAQPHLDGGWTILPDGPAQHDVVKPPAGDYAVLLDVWPRHVTALEDPALPETALGGVDTTTRVQTAWQVKLLPIGPTTTCAGVAALPAWVRHASPPTGRLLAATDLPPPAPDACDLSPSGGYQGLENQLYRVEIHDAGGMSATGAVAAATFKWATDNASIATVATAWDADATVQVASVGRDFSTGWRIGDTAELLDAVTEARGLPGRMLTVAGVDGTALVFAGAHGLGAATSGAAAAARGVRVRRWSGAVQAVPAGGAVVKLGEDGVVVRFDGAAAATWRTGDYWMIPARTASAAIEWAGGFQPPHGVAHRWALLGRFRIDAAGTISQLTDCRTLFPPLTAMLDFGYAGGDGQQVEPRETGNAQPIALPHPLQVRVTRGRLPVVGAKVRFRIEAGPGGTLGLDADGTVTVQADGLASCPWALDATVGIAPQRVVAELLDDGSIPVAAPIRFGARVIGLLAMRLNGGDTQTVSRRTGEAGPFALPVPLAVAVTQGGRPAAGRLVRFEVIGGGGTLDGGGASVDVPSGATGIAECRWTLASEAPGAAVRARLMQSPGVAWGLPDVTFSAGVLTLSDGGGGCDVTVGEDGQFATLNEAVATLLKQGVANICICLKPGEHEVTDPIEVPPTKGLRLVIHGCGPASRLFVRRAPIAVRGIATFELRDLALTLDRAIVAVRDTPTATFRHLSVAGESERTFLDIAGVARLTIEGCRIVANADVPVVAIDGFAGSRRILRNQIVGIVAFGEGRGLSRTKLLALVRPKASATNGTGPQNAATRPKNAIRPGADQVLTIADNRMSALFVSEKLIGLLANDPTQMPLGSRVDGNVFAQSPTTIPGEMIVFQANAFLSAGNNLLMSVREGDDRPTIKIASNLADRDVVIRCIGYWQEMLNAPIHIT